MANETKIQDIIRTSLENIRNLVDANTVIGNPINTESGVTIIPISKVSVGFATGGLDYAVKNEPVNSVKPKNFGGGGGTGLSVTPVGFLVIKPDGQVEMIEAGAGSGAKAPSDPVGQIADLIDRSPAIIAKFKELFAKKPAEAKEEEKAEEDKAE